MYYYFVYPYLLGVSGDVSSLTFTRFFAILGVAVPPIIGGIIFMIIGLYIMKTGLRKTQSQPHIQPLDH
jgi:putative Mn2+ efflux pump MntP